MFYLKNLSSHEILQGAPWLCNDLNVVPTEYRGTEGKKAREEWMTNPKTEFHAYSLFEGVNPNLRVNKGGKKEEGNPPCYQKGFVGDYDTPYIEAEFLAGLARIENPALHPNWIEKSLSGNYRLLWIFPQPLPIPSYDFAVGWLKHIEKVIPLRSWVGIDEGALKAPERYFTNGCQWRKLNPNPFPWAVLLGEYIKFSAAFDFRGAEFGPTIPLEVIAEKCREKFPRFASWPGDFTLGAQGPTFWIDESLSPKSAVVRETGMQTFSAHAGKPFFTWPELLGAEFCQNFEREEMAKACEGIYYDEKNYFSKNAAGIWCIDNQTNISIFLKTARGLSDFRRKGENSTKLERALNHIQRMNRVKKAASFPFYPEGFTKILDEQVLNLHTRCAMAPAPVPGPMPFLWAFLQSLFSSPDQLDYFLSWLSRYYKSCYLRAPCTGQALFIAGGTNVGKTFLLRAVIGRLVGGFAEANDFMTKTDLFNSELFDYGFWCIDDGSISTSHHSHKLYSEMVKRVVANPTLRCNGKFLKANTVAAHIRLGVSLNTDMESMRMIPDNDLSMREKVMLFRTHDVAQVKFLEQDQMEKMLAAELPYLARFLLDYQMPEHCISGDPRFGVISYQEKSLVNISNQSSVSGAFGEIIEEWMRTYFTQQEPQADKWEGTSLQLHKAILFDATLVETMKPFNLQTLGRMIVNLAAKKIFPITIDGDSEKRIITVLRDTARFPKPPNDEPTQGGVTFQKK